MSLDNDAEADTLDMILRGVDPSWRAGATAYLALVSLASPDEADPLATELTYTGYARVALTKSSAWTTGGSSRTNTGLIQFGKRTDGGATQYARAAVIVDTASGPVNMAVIATIGDELPVSLNIRTQFDIGTVTVTAE